MTEVSVTIRGLQEAMDANAKAVAALQPKSAFGRGIKEATIIAHRGVVRRAHVDTGAMKAAQRMKVQERRGRVYTDPGACNPRGKTRPAEYAVYEEGRGGSHAFYKRTVKEDGQKIANRAMRVIRRGLP